MMRQVIPIVWWHRATCTIQRTTTSKGKKVSVGGKPSGLFGRLIGRLMNWYRPKVLAKGYITWRSGERFAET